MFKTNLNLNKNPDTCTKFICFLSPILAQVIGDSSIKSMVRAGQEQPCAATYPSLLDGRAGHVQVLVHRQSKRLTKSKKAQLLKAQTKDRI